jgi:acyl-coenzyme A synthetase/AMP-(fatty) acid ligase/acyl carrier protein
MQREPGFAKTDTLLAVTTLSFDIAGLELYLPLVSGGRLVIASYEDTHDPARLMERMRSCNCTVMQATPATWRALIDAGWSGSANLKLLCGGESLPRDLLQKLLPRCKELWNMYGPTETTIWSTIQRVTSADAPVLIGRPIANTQTFVLDGHRNLVPEGVVGELYIGGAGVARGYLGRPDLTEERFVQSPFEPSERLYRTGDLARWTCGGFLECLGRVDTQVKIRGYRIELGEIETALSRHEAVRQCVVVVREDTPGDKRLVAYFETRTESTPTVSDLRGYLAKELPDYMIPSISVPLEKLPVTPNGKIDRKALPIPAYEHMQPAHDSVEPRTEIEKALALIWTELLRVDNIGIDDEFFNLGGHSVLAIQVVSRIRDVFGVKISIQALFDNPTIADLANVLTTAKSSEAKTDQHQLLVRIRPDTSERPPFFCVPGAGGNVLNMRPLAMALPADFPFYCFQYKGLNDSEPFESVEETARCYLDEIRQVQPHGPYYLGGYCYGGLVAFEIARRLEELGEPVAALVLMEASNPTFVRSLSAPEWLFRNVRFGMWRVAWHARRMLTQRPDEWLGYIGRLRKALRKHLGDSAERAAGREAEIIEALPGTPLGKNLKRVIHATFIAASKFVLKPYAGRALIFRNSARNFDPYDDYYLGWESVVRGGIECFEFEGDHLGMLEEPAVRLIAEKLNAELAQSSAGIGASALHVSAGFRK